MEIKILFQLKDTAEFIGTRKRKCIPRIGEKVSVGSKVFRVLDVTHPLDTVNVTHDVIVDVLALSDAPASANLSEESVIECSAEEA